MIIDGIYYFRYQVNLLEFELIII